MKPLDALYRQAVDHPDNVAFSSGDNIYSYRRLAAEVEHMAQALVTRGLQAGDRVVLHMTNRPEMVIACYACFRMGVIAVPINLRFKSAELRDVLQRLKPTLYIGEAELYSEVAPIEPEILSLDARFIVGSATDHKSVQSWSDLFTEMDGTPIPQPHDAHIPAVLLTTSGTTGQPKLVTHTAETLSAMMNTWPNLELNSQQIAVVATPMVHASGFMTCLGCIQHGVRMVLLERFAPDAVLDAIEIHHWLTRCPEIRWAR